MLTNSDIKKLYAKAQQAQKSGQLDKAAQAYQRILKANPRVAEAHFNLARVFVAKRSVAPAASHFEAALKLKPAEPAIWLAYLDMASLHPNIDNLAKLLKRAGTQLDKFAEISFFRGLVDARTGQGNARILFEAAIAKGLQSPRVFIELGTALAKEGESDTALAQFDRALELKPDDDLALSKKAELLRNVGQYDAALDAARAAINAAPNIGAHYYSYASIRKIRPDDPIIDQMKAVLAKAKPSDRSYGELAHAAAKAMEDSGQRDQVFRYLDLANDAANRAFPYEQVNEQQAFRSVRDRYLQFSAESDAELLEDLAPTPLFVTGMPRSGTTLVEQILSSHSACEGGGEMSILSPLLASAFQQADDGEQSLDGALKAAGTTYRSEVKKRFPNARYVTDKSISSFASIGFIRHALPDAKFIVVRRDPRDNALSLYKNLFRTGTHRYATNLRSIAQHYRLFEKQVAFWADQTPDAFSEIKYEELIGDPEAQSRQLVSNAGLAWEDACLSFYDNRRRVDTLSTTQVRQPIYSSSVGAWKHYEAEMAPFLDEFGPVA